MPRTVLQFKGKDIPKKYRTLARRVPELRYRGLRDTAEQAKTEFEKTVSTWKNKPEFEIRDTARGMTVATESEIYKFVDKGTRPHKIRPVNASKLAFQRDYRPKTTPRVIGSNSGGASGAVVHTLEVNHPGTEARDFSKIIFEEAQENVGKNITQRLKEGLDAVGL